MTIQQKTEFIEALFKPEVYEMPCYVDGFDLSDKIQGRIEENANNGWSLQSITPLTSGSYKFSTPEESKFNSRERSSFGLGFSFTEGVLLLFHRE